MSHARLGPSNHRWPHCPGSVREEASYPDITGDAAIDGTGSHTLLELCLIHGVRADAYEGQIIGVGHHDQPMGWIVNQDRIDRVQMCLDYVTRRVHELNDEFPGSIVTVEAETKADPGGMFGRTDWWGTTDITITVSNKRGDYYPLIEVCDYKDGRGWVDARDNTQLISYMAGKMRPIIGSGPDLLRPFQSSRVGACRMSIVQPKTNPVVRYQDVDPSQVIKRAEELSMAAARTDDPNAPLVSGEHCQWCKHKKNCTAESEQSLSTVGGIMNDVIASDGNSLFELVSSTMVNMGEVDSEKLAQLADARAGIEAVFDKVEAEIQRRIEAGESVSGYAMLPGRNSNKWNVDEETIAKMLKGRRLSKDIIYPTSLISPAQVLKLKELTDEQKAKIQKEYISSVAGKLTLSKVSRESKKPEVEKMFTEAVAQCTTDDIVSLPVVQPISFF